MKLCPRCQTENPDDADFCSKCRNYLRWEPTTAVPAATRRAAPQPPSTSDAAPPATPGPAREPPTEPIEPSPPPAAATPVPQSEVQMTLRGIDGGASGRPAVTMPPGGEARLRGEVRNHSGKVDNYDLRLDGIPPDWYTIEPSTVYLVPFGARAGEFEHEIEVRFHPPRTAAATAGARPVTLVATSRASAADVGAVEADVTITPFHELEGELRPERVGGRRRGSFAIAVQNHGNAPAEVELEGEDEERALRYRFEHPTLTARPGRRVGTAFTVTPGKQIWVGRAVDKPFQITARAVEAEAEAAPVRGVFRHKPWLPWWSPIVAALVIAAAIAGYQWWTGRPVTVPSLRGQTLAQARVALDSAHLKLSTDLPQTKTLPNDPQDWGKVISQTPQGQSSAKRGTVVSVVLGEGPATAKVPPLCGMTLAQVTAAVQAAKLSLVPPDPTPTATDHSLATGCQAPQAGQMAPEGSPVKVTFPGANGGAGGGGGGGGGSAALPAGAAAAAAAGFDVQQVPELAPKVPFGSTIYQSPPAGQMLPKGSSITAYVSQPPPVALDDGVSVFTQEPGAKPAKLATTAGASDTEPTVTMDDTKLAYVSRAPVANAPGVVHVIDLSAKPALDQPLATGVDAHRPAFAPDPARHLLVYSVWPATGTGSSLCFVDLDQPAAPSCTTPDTTYDLDRPAWSPKGHSIVAAVIDPTLHTSVGLVQFRTTPASPKFDATGTDWTESPLVLSEPVQFAAFSPMGKQLALSVGTSPVLEIAKVHMGAIQPPTAVGAAPIPAGALDWWADGRLAIASPTCPSSSTTPVTPPISVIDLNAATPTPTPVPGQAGCDPSYLPQLVYRPGATP